MNDELIARLDAFAAKFEQTGTALYHAVIREIVMVGCGPAALGVAVVAFGVLFGRRHLRMMRDSKTSDEDAIHAVLAIVSGIFVIVGLVLFCTGAWDALAPHRVLIGR